MCTLRTSNRRHMTSVSDSWAGAKRRRLLCCVRSTRLFFRLWIHTDRPVCMSCFIFTASKARSAFSPGLVECFTSCSKWMCWTGGSRWWSHSRIIWFSYEHKTIKKRKTQARFVAAPVLAVGQRRSVYACYTVNAQCAGIQQSTKDAINCGPWWMAAYIAVTH